MQNSSLMTTLKKVFCALAILPGSYIGMLFFLKDSDALINEYIIVGSCICYILNLISIFLVKNNNKKKIGIKLRALRTFSVVIISSNIFFLLMIGFGNGFPNSLARTLEIIHGSELFFLVLFVSPVYWIFVTPGWALYYLLDSLSFKKLGMNET